MKSFNGDIFLERSLGSAITFLKDAVFSEEIASAKGLLQRMDCRVKMAACLAALIWISFLQELELLALLYVFSLILARASRIKVAYFIKRVWIFIPLFSLIIAVPAFFWHGPVPAARFVLRVADSISFAALAVLTTKKSVFLRALSIFGIPAIFIQTLDMMYTYLFLLMKGFEEMHVALKARLVRRFTARESRRWIASRISALYVKSYYMSREVYQAMLARGYTGEGYKDGRAGR